MTFRAQTAAKPPGPSTFTGNQATGGNAAGWAAQAAAPPAVRRQRRDSATVSAARAGRPERYRRPRRHWRRRGDGGGLFNTGTASFTGVTVNLKQPGTERSPAVSAAPAAAPPAAAGGSGGVGHRRQRRQRHRRRRRRRRRGRQRRGGGIFNAITATLTIKPRHGAKKGSKQAKATDVITANLAPSRLGRAGGAGGSATGGLGKRPGGNGTRATPGQPGATEIFSVGIGGGIATFGTAIRRQYDITGNQASTTDPDVDGTITP